MCICKTIVAVARFGAQSNLFALFWKVACGALFGGHEQHLLSTTARMQVLATKIKKTQTHLIEWKKNKQTATLTICTTGSPRAGAIVSDARAVSFLTVHERRPRPLAGLLPTPRRLCTPH